MTHEELTYGCHVYWRGEKHRVVGIEKCDKTETNAVCIELPIGVTYRDIKELKPIPITSEWLSKNGFQKNRLLWRTKHIWEKECNGQYILLESIGETYWRFCVNYNHVYGEIKRIRYVHQMESLLNVLGCN